MRILYVITGLAYGGAEMQLSTLVHAMKNKGEVKVISIAPQVDLIDKFEGINIEVIPLSNIKSFIKLFRSTYLFKPDIIHSHMIHSNIIMSFLSFILGKTCYCTSHNTDEGGDLRMLLMKWSYKLFKPKISHVSEMGIEKYKYDYKIRYGEIRKYINPIDLSFFTFKQRLFPENGARWVNVASLTEQKRHDRLILAFYEHVKKYPNDTLNILGSGQKHEKLRELISKLDLSECVYLLGNRDDVVNILHQSHYFILSSDWEGLPVAIIEAMSTGLPVVSTDCGDISTIIKSEFNGELTQKTSQSLLAAMDKVRSGASSNYQKLSVNALNTVQVFDVENVSADLYQDYLVN